MGRRVRAIKEGLRGILSGGPGTEFMLGVRLVPTRCAWCEDWMVICEGEPDLAPAELRHGLCPSCREHASAAPRVAVAGL